MTGINILCMCPAAYPPDIFVLPSSRSTHTPSRSHGMLGGTCCPDPAPTPSPGTESTRAHRHRPRGGGPRLDRGATGSHSGLGGAEVRDGWDWTSWSLEGGWLRTQRAHPRAPWEHSHPPGSPPRVQAGGHGYSWTTGSATPPVAPPAAEGRSGILVSPERPRGHLLGPCPHPARAARCLFRLPLQLGLAGKGGFTHPPAGCEPGSRRAGCPGKSPGLGQAGCCHQGCGADAPV